MYSWIKSKLEIEGHASIVSISVLKLESNRIISNWCNQRDKIGIFKLNSISFIIGLFKLYCIIMDESTIEFYNKINSCKASITSSSSNLNYK